MQQNIKQERQRGDMAHYKYYNLIGWVDQDGNYT